MSRPDNSTSIGVNLAVFSIFCSVCSIVEMLPRVTIAVIRLAIRKAIQYGGSLVGESVTGNQALLILTNIESTLSSYGLSYVVTMEAFADAAVRVGLDRMVGIRLYQIMDLLI